MNSRFVKSFVAAVDTVDSIPWIALGLLIDPNEVIGLVFTLEAARDLAMKLELLSKEPEFARGEDEETTARHLEIIEHQKHLHHRFHDDNYRVNTSEVNKGKNVAILKIESDKTVDFQIILDIVSMHEILDALQSALKLLKGDLQMTNRLQ